MFGPAGLSRAHGVDLERPGTQQDGRHSDTWSRELVFLGLHSVPVYPMSVLGDLFVVNSVEFWSGDNPITREPALVDEKN